MSHWILPQVKSKPRLSKSGEQLSQHPRNIEPNVSPAPDSSQPTKYFTPDGIMDTFCSGSSGEFNENLKVDIKEDQTAAGSTGKGHYIKAGLYQTGITRYLKVIGEDPNWQKGQDPKKFPTQIVYMDNIFKVSSKEKLDVLIEKAK